MPIAFDSIVPKESKNSGKTRPKYGRAPKVLSDTIVERPVLMTVDPVSDDKKRMFLQLAGLGGIGAIAAMLLPKRAQAFVMGGSPTSGVVGVKDSNNIRIDPAQENGGHLASIDSAFSNSAVGGYVRQNSATPTIALESGGNLAVIAARIPILGSSTKAASMPVVIASDQTPIPVTGTFGGGIDPVGLKNSIGTQIDPATEGSLILLKRLVKQADSLGVVDAAQRQRVTVEGATITSGTITTVTTVTTVATASNLVALGGVDSRYLFIDTARNMYANGIRNHLIYT